MKKLMLFATFISLSIIGADGTPWKMVSRKRVEFCCSDDIPASKYFLQTDTGDKIGLNHRGNPVFLADGVICEQSGKLFVMHVNFYHTNAAIHHEELLCEQLGNKEARRIYHLLQARMRE